jgi:hypothetical protein
MMAELRSEHTAKNLASGFATNGHRWKSEKRFQGLPASPEISPGYEE